MSDPKPHTGRVRGLVALTLALLASLAGNAYLLKSEEHERQATSAVRLDPAGAEVYASDRAAQAPPPARPVRPVLVFFGDSRALMWSPPPLPEYQVVDRGIGNQTTAQILLRVDTDVTPLHPAVVVLEAGVNDLKTLPEFPSRRAAIVAGCEANLRAIVLRLRAAGATVVLATVFSIGHVPLWRRPFWSDDVAASVVEVNGFLRGLAGDRVALLDANAALDAGGHEVKPAYQRDYLHLVPAGYAALNDALVPLVRGLHAPGSQ